MNKLHNMKLHELMTLNNEDGSTIWVITRVPNGWIYDYNNTAVFVPYHEEFTGE